VRRRCIEFVTHNSHHRGSADWVHRLAYLKLTSIEICAGAGGQAIGLEAAGFDHLALVEIDSAACETLRLNRPAWDIYEADLNLWSANQYVGQVHLLAGGVPCPPFSKAGRQLGSADERDLFPVALRIIRECQPSAVMLENVRGLLDRRFEHYRAAVREELELMGYHVWWSLLNACDFGVPQLRPRSILVALKRPAAQAFAWPIALGGQAPPTVGQALKAQMASCGWEGANEWALRADEIAPTLVGGSKKHGGPDLGPTRAKRQWAKLGVDAHGLADAPPPPRFRGLPRLTVSMTAKLQGFPDDWTIVGRKTPAYRQVGNALPPPVARAVGLQIAEALRSVHGASAAA
jgi:DNA (cytosine-5)-methyltransferase 1